MAHGVSGEWWGLIAVGGESTKDDQSINFWPPYPHDQLLRISSAKCTASAACGQWGNLLKWISSWAVFLLSFNYSIYRVFILNNIGMITEKVIDRRCLQPPTVPLFKDNKIIVLSWC